MFLNGHKGPSLAQRRNIIKRNKRGYCSRKADGWTGARSVPREPDAQGQRVHGVVVPPWCRRQSTLGRGWEQPLAGEVARAAGARGVRKAQGKRRSNAGTHTAKSERPRDTHVWGTTAFFNFKRLGLRSPRGTWPASVGWSTLRGFWEGEL